MRRFCEKILRGTSFQWSSLDKTLLTRFLVICVRTCRLGRSLPAISRWPVGQVNSEIHAHQSVMLQWGARV
jgi:hypothetical protein